MLDRFVLGRDGRKLRRNPPIAAGLFHTHMSETGERKMRAGYPPTLLCRTRQQPLLCRTRQQRLACRNGLLAVTIELKRGGRVRELYCVVVHDIAPNQQILAIATLEKPRGMSRRMTVR